MVLRQRVFLLTLAGSAFVLRTGGAAGSGGSAAQGGVQRGDVVPLDVVVHQGAGAHLAARRTAVLGQETHAHAVDLLRTHFLGRVHALLAGVGGVVERSDSVKLQID